MHPKCLNLSDPACQKTGSVVVFIQYLWEELGVKSAFVMPKSLLMKNKEEILTFTGLEDHEVQIVDGTPKQRASQLANTNAVVFLMGFQRWSDDWEMIMKLHPSIKACHVDEFHLGYSGWNSKRTQAWYASTHHVNYGVLMTGTIIKGKLSSAFPAVQFVEPRFYGSYGAFMGYHAEFDEYGTVIGWKNHEKLGAIFGEIAVRSTFAEVHGPEAKVIITELCEMGTAQRKAYDQMEAAALVELEDSFLSAGSPGVEAIRCRQIMSHPETMGIGKDEPTGKDERLKVHLADAVQSGEPLVIFASLVPEQVRIAKMAKDMGLRVGLINGTVDAKRRGAIDLAFRNGQLDCIVASADTAGVGFNWAHIKVMVFTSLNYQDDSFIQAYRRGIRGKRETPLLIYILEYRNSIDQRIMFIIQQKSELANAVDSTKEVFRLSQKDDEMFSREAGKARKVSMASFSEN